MQILVNGEIILYGAVGDGWWEEGFTDRDVVMALAELADNDEIVVRINSFGGDAYMGFAIYNAFKAAAAKIIMYVDGIAASSGSIIPMAADELVMSTGSVMMIHEPASFAGGTAEDLEKSAEALDKLGAQAAVIYAQKAIHKTTDEIRELMKAETWFTADQAVEAGFADISEVKGDPVAAMMFDYRQFNNAPAQLVEMAMANASLFKRPPEAVTPPPKETERTETMVKPTDVQDDEPEKTIDIEKVKLDASDETKKRIADITTCDESGGKSDLAVHLAFNTNISLEESKAILLKANSKSVEMPAPKAEESTDDIKMLDGVELMAGGDKTPSAPKLSLSGIYEKRAADVKRIGA